jgi:hypothetical protein
MPAAGKKEEDWPSLAGNSKQLQRRYDRAEVMGLECLMVRDRAVFFAVVDSLGVERRLSDVEL